MPQRQGLLLAQRQPQPAWHADWWTGTQQTCQPGRHRVRPPTPASMSDRNGPVMAKARHAMTLRHARQQLLASKQTLTMGTSAAGHRDNVNCLPAHRLGCHVNCCRCWPCRPERLRLAAPACRTAACASASALPGMHLSSTCTTRQAQCSSSSSLGEHAGAASFAQSTASDSCS